MLTINIPVGDKTYSIEEFGSVQWQSLGRWFVDCIQKMGIELSDEMSEMPNAPTMTEDEAARLVAELIPDTTDVGIGRKSARFLCSTSDLIVLFVVLSTAYYHFAAERTTDKKEKAAMIKLKEEMLASLNTPDTVETIPVTEDKATKIKQLEAQLQQLTA